MPQNPLAATIAKNPAGALVALNEDAAGLLLTSGGGNQSKLNITAASVVKASAGRLCRIVVQTVGTAGNLTINDLPTTSGAAAANQIFTAAYTGLTVGQVITLEWPCANGIAVSAIPTGGAVAISFA